MNRSARIRTLKGTVLLIAAIILLRLFYIQVLDDTYKTNAANNVLRYMVQYPPRGEVYDRNGEFLVQSKEAYDLMVTPREVHDLDTLLMSRILEIPVEQLREELAKARRYSPYRASVVVKQLPKETKLKLEEHTFPGFYTVYRTVRSYPTKMAGNLLGYVGEVNERIIERNPYYRSGDYIGMSGIEQAYEEVLRGVKGVKIEMVDVHGVPQGSYANGIYDTLASPGVAITCTIDARLQALAEELMQGKVGSVVAIEPETGEILVMASSPTYDPDELVGRERGNNYMKLLNDPRRPLYNRAVMSPYPPGSTFKVLQGLIGLQEGVLVPEQTYPCHGGYPYGRGMKCHAHSSPRDLKGAIQTSCNAYFCYVFRNIIENKKYDRTRGDGLHPAANGQHGGYHRQSRLLPDSARRQAYPRPRLDRSPILREALYEGGSPPLRSYCRRNVYGRERRWHRTCRHGSRTRHLREDRNRTEPSRQRQQYVLLFRATQQSENRRIGLHRKRRVWSDSSCTDCKPADGVLPDGYDQATRSGRKNKNHANRLPIL